MISSEKAIVLGLERNAYTDRTGSEVEHLYLYYYLPLDYHDPKTTRTEGGYTLLRIDLFPDFFLRDFPDKFPAFYDLKFRTVRGRQGKPEPRLTEINFEKPIPADDSKGYIVLGAKNIMVPTEDSKKPYQGVKLFALGSFVNEEDRIGVLPIEVNLQNGKLVDFQRLPGVYDLDLQSVRGRGGTSVYRLRSVRFIEPWGEIPKQQTQPQTTQAG